MNFSRDELFILQRVARLAGVDLQQLLRVVLALRVSAELPRLVTRK